MKGMLFQVTAEGHIRVLDADGNGQDNTFASEPELHELTSAWPMKRLIEIWNHLPGVEPVMRFTDRNTAICRLWRGPCGRRRISSSAAQKRRRRLCFGRARKRHRCARYWRDRKGRH